MVDNRYAVAQHQAKAQRKSTCSHAAPADPKPEAHPHGVASISRVQIANPVPRSVSTNMGGRVASAYRSKIDTNHSNLRKDGYHALICNSSTGGPFPLIVNRSELQMDLMHEALENCTNESESSDVNLSARECSVLLLMSHGLSNKEIAQRLSIGPETVKTYAKSIFLKLTARSRAQAVYQALTLGLI